MSTITSVHTRDVRFPTSRMLDGSDAMNPDPDYSAAYVVVRTDAADRLEGHAFAFTIGRGNEVQVVAIASLAPLLVGYDVEALLADMGRTWRLLVHDSPLRWLGPEKGVMHMAIGAVVNALWDLKAKRAGQPLWQLLSGMSPGLAAIARRIAPIKVAAGEHVANRVVFKQLLQADALSFVQIDATRVAGVNENVAVLLLAAKFGKRVCPHAGGVGLCELVQHLSMFDYVAVSGSLQDRVIEYVDHLHEHFIAPVVVREGRYLAPDAPGSGATMRAESLERFGFPDGEVWAS